MIKSSAALSKLLPALEGRSLETLPESMRRAVRLMISGAAATAVWGIFLVIVTIANHAQLVGENGRKLGSGQIAGGAIYNLLVTIILAAIWVLMARMNQRGRNWARITATALFVLWSIECFATIGGATATPLVIIDMVLVFLVWAIGLGALFFLWRPDSSDYFKSGGRG
jgi:hypothetical protein